MNELTWTKDDDGSYTSGTAYMIVPASGKFRIFKYGEIMPGERRGSLAALKQRVAELIEGEQANDPLPLPESALLPARNDVDILQGDTLRLSDEMASAIEGVSDEEIDYLPPHPVE